MNDARTDNARLASTAAGAVARSVIITGDEASTAVARQIFGTRDQADVGPLILQEAGRKGNLLGSLQAWSSIRGDVGGESGGADVEQLVMFVGTGSRLSPITQSLCNMKAALPLPSGHAERGVLTVGEAAIMSSAPWIRALRDGGFEGILIRWGDEIIVPSTVMSPEPGRFADVDAIRFGYYATPTEMLASQKEWLLTDERGVVYAELPRQPLDRLLQNVSRYRLVKALHVNLGSFAISFTLLDALTEAFGDLIGPDDLLANWDPYLWMALHSTSSAEWERDCRAGSAEVPRDFAQLLDTIPDFWRRTRRARTLLVDRNGRDFTSQVVDFGDPYWFDAGNHSALRTGISDLFREGRDGDTVRAFLGLPADLATGGSFLHDADLPEGVEVRNSIVVGSSIRDEQSIVERAVILSSDLGRVRADPGSVSIQCTSAVLEIDGPAGFALRLHRSAHVSGDEVTAGVATPDGELRLSHFGPDLIIDGRRFETAQWSNPVSFKRASELAATATSSDGHDTPAGG